MKHLRVQTDGTAAGTKVICPDGTEVKVKAIQINVVARELEEVEMTFYLSRHLYARNDGTPEGSGLFFANNERMDGLISIEIDPADAAPPLSACKVRFYPAGSKGANVITARPMHPAIEPPPHAMNDRDLVNTLLGLTSMAGGFVPGPTRDRTKALEEELMMRLNFKPEAITEVRRILKADEKEGTTAAAARRMKERNDLMEELDADGCAKWATEKREIIEALDKLGAPTIALSTPPGIGNTALSIVGRIRALADRSIHVHNIMSIPPTATPIIEFMGRPVSFWGELQSILQTIELDPGEQLPKLREIIREYRGRGQLLLEAMTALDELGAPKKSTGGHAVLNLVGRIRYLAAQTEATIMAVLDEVGAPRIDPACTGMLLTLAGRIRRFAVKHEKQHEAEAGAAVQMLYRIAAAAGAPAEAPDAETLVQGITKAIKDRNEMAWTIIASAYGGDWASAPGDWREAAKRWGDEVHGVIQREVAAEKPADPCSHANVWVFHQAPNSEHEVVQHGTCMGCNRVVHRWATTNDLQPNGQWCVGNGDSLTLPRSGFVEPFLAPVHAAEAGQA